MLVWLIGLCGLVGLIRWYRECDFGFGLCVIGALPLSFWVWGAGVAVACGWVCGCVLVFGDLRSGCCFRVLRLTAGLLFVVLFGLLLIDVFTWVCLLVWVGYGLLFRGGVW